MSKRFATLFLLFWVGISAIAQHPAARKSFNRSWKFYLGDKPGSITINASSANLQKTSLIIATTK